MTPTLHELENNLWLTLEMADPEAWARLGHRRWNINQRIRTELNAYLGWIICPREHAKQYGLYVLVIKTEDAALASRALFADVGRYHAGPDAVFALADLQ